MSCIRHRSASGDFSSLWEFDPARRVVDVVMTQGSATVAFTVDVCAIDRPRFGAYAITRLDGESWKLLPIRWSTHPTGHYVDDPIHASLGHGKQLILTNAPAEVDAELEAL